MLLDPLLVRAGKYSVRIRKEMAVTSSPKISSLQMEETLV